MKKSWNVGDRLYDALRGSYTVLPLTETDAGLTIDDAYEISLRFLDRRLSDGEKVIGKKIGVTSKAVQDMLGAASTRFWLSDRCHGGCKQCGCAH